MKEAKKMEALKAAFAEVILNTTVEAAARIVVSERSAARMERDLWAAKEAALNMAVRAKEMMDFQCAEAERLSSIQKKRIKELETQLIEAENVISDIKDELKVAQDELAKYKSINQVKFLDEQCVNKSIASSKEPDVYQRGCTPERIRAALPLQGETSNHHMEKSLIKEDEAAQGLCILAHGKEENMIMTVKSRMEKLSKNCIKSNQTITRFSNRKRKRKFRRTEAVLSTRNVVSSHKTSTPSSCETYACMDSTDIVKATDSPTRIAAKSKLCRAPLSSMNMIEEDPFSARIELHCRTAKLGESECFPNEDKESTHKFILEGQKHRDADISKVSVCTINPKTDRVTSVNPSAEGCLNCETASEAHPRSVNEKFLKYTFHRKRKKRSLSSANENDSPERNASNGSLEEHRVGPELQKSCLSFISSRESRRLMQVARQDKI